MGSHRLSTSECEADFMRLGLSAVNIGRHTDPTEACEIARRAEALGFESLWAVDHVVIPKGYQSRYPFASTGRMGMPDDSSLADPLMWLSYVASATTKIKLATGMLVLPQREPVAVAKQCATLARLAGNRLILGIGSGWLEEEFTALGADWSTRMARQEEYVAALRCLWSQSPATFDGRFVRFENVYCEPRPPGGAIPIVLGGSSPAAARRAGRIADGYYPVTNDPDELRRLVRDLREAASAAGRDPDSIELTARYPDDPDVVEALHDIGVTRLITSLANVEPDAASDQLERIVSTVSDCQRAVTHERTNRC